MTAETHDYLSSPGYQRFVADMAKHCRCTRGPCDGVLAGGMCHEIIDDDEDDDDTIWDAGYD